MRKTNCYYTLPHKVRLPVGHKLSGCPKGYTLPHEVRLPVGHKLSGCPKGYTLAMIGICMSLVAGCAQAGSAGISSTEVSSVAAAETTKGMTVEEVAASFEQEDAGIDWESQDYTLMNVESGSAAINESGIYVLTGMLEEGSITVDIDKNVDSKTVYLVLQDMTIGSSVTAPIYIKEAKKVVIILADGTTNNVNQGSGVETDDQGDPSSAIYSKADLTITGTGTLNVITEFNDGITSKDDLKITGGVINVQAAGDGIVGKDLLAVETAQITINAGKDGMKSTNSTESEQGNITISDGTFTITAANDTIQAEQILQIDGGTFQLSSGGGYPGESIKQGNTGMRGQGGMGGPNGMRGQGGISDQNGMTLPQDVTPEAAETETDVSAESQKGLKAGSSVIVNGGNFTISSYEDAVHSNGDVTISGGIWTIEAGDDAIHADNTVTVEQGQITIANSCEGIEGSNIAIRDGTIDLVSSDDGVNVSSQSGTLIVNGGSISVKSGGDGLDSNGNIVQNGGSIVIDSQSVGAGDTPVDYDGTFTSNGGTLTDENGTAISPEAGNRGGGHGQIAPGGTPGERPEGRGCMKGEATDGDENL